MRFNWRVAAGFAATVGALFGLSALLTWMATLHGDIVVYWGVGLYALALAIVLGFLTRD